MVIVCGGKDTWHLSLQTVIAPAVESNQPKALRSSRPAHEGAAAITLSQEEKSERSRPVSTCQSCQLTHALTACP